jgi:anti-sigma factor RsiW
MQDERHEAFEADFSDYFERTLPPARQREVETHLEACATCRAEYDRFKETLGALSGLHKMSAPQHFEAHVEDTLHRRSAGRFFGPRTFGDRFPFAWIAILGFLLALAALLLTR